MSYLKWYIQPRTYGKTLYRYAKTLETFFYRKYVEFIFFTNVSVPRLNPIKGLKPCF